MGRREGARFDDAARLRQCAAFEIGGIARVERGGGHELRKRLLSAEISHRRRRKAGVVRRQTVSGDRRLGRDRFKRCKALR